jgi:HEAT repeat protein
MAAPKSDQSLANLVAALRGGGKKAQVEALHAIGKRDDPRAIPALVATLKSADPDLRALAMGKLVFLNHRRLVPILVKGLRDAEPRVRQHALYALQRLKAREAAGAIARALANDASDIVRFNAALALAAVGDRRHKAAFVRATKDRSTNVAATALRALVALAPREAASLILRLVRDPKRWARVPETLRDVTLRMMRTSLTEAPVVRFLRRLVREGIAKAKAAGRPPRSMELVEAACLLAEAGDATGTPVLHECLKGVDYSQERGLKALAQVRDRSAVPLIIAKPLQNVFYAIKLKAIRAIGEIGDARALPALAVFFNDRTDDFPVDPSITFTKDDPDLRATALAAIAKIAARGLREAAASPDPFQSKLARQLARNLSQAE